MEDQDIQNLLDKYRSGTATEAEKSLLENWYLQRNSRAISELSALEFSEDLELIGKGLPLQRPVRKISWLPRLSAAAAVKTLNDALELRNHILKQVELSTITADPDEKTKLLNFVIAGGGPTGVELSGMLADMRKFILKKDYPELTPENSNGNIYLVDGMDAVLKPMSPRSQKDTFEALTAMGVKIMLNKQVKDYKDDQVIFTDGKSIPTKTLIWAAGVTGTMYQGLPVESYGRGKRLIVDAYNKVTGFKNIYAIGDISIQTHETKYPGGHPQVAQVAIQQGVNLAENLKNQAYGKEQVPFKYHDKGSMAIIGRHRAVVDMPGNKVHFRGFLAWAMWLFIHLISLVSARNKITTLYNWTGTYFSKDQSLTTPQMKSYAMDILHRGKKSDVRKAKAYGLVAMLNHIYTVGDHVFLDIAFQNKTNLPYDIDELRFKIEDKKITKATNNQSLEIKPEWQLYQQASFKNEYHNIYVFKKVTFPGNKILNVELSEKQVSGRTLTLQIKYGDLLKADNL